MGKIELIRNCAAAGAGLGFVGGFAFAWLSGIAAQVAAPADPTAGAVAIMVMYTAPGGLILGAAIGAAIGAVLAARRK